MLRIAAGAIDALKAHPLALALVAINFAFLLSITFTLHEISSAVERKDAMLARCIK